MVEKQLFVGLMMDLVTRTRVSAHVDASPLIVCDGLRVRGELCAVGWRMASSRFMVWRGNLNFYN